MYPAQGQQFHFNLLILSQLDWAPFSLNSPRELQSLSSQTALLLKGTVVLPVSYRGEQYSLQFYVVNKPVQAILGLKACELLNVIQRVEEMSI